MAMGLSLGHVTSTQVAVVVLVGVVTMTLSTYMILGADKLFRVLKKYLTIFEKKVTKEISLIGDKKFEDHIVLVGAGRTGRRLISFLSRKNTPFLVVDYNPSVFTTLAAEKKPVLFGDINDEEIFVIAGVDRAKLVISTTSSLTDNLSVLSEIKKLRRKPSTIFTALTKDEAVKYYEAGVDHVILPQTVAGEHIRHLLITYGIGGERIKKIGSNHFRRLLHT